LHSFFFIWGGHSFGGDFTEFSVKRPGKRSLKGRQSRVWAISNHESLRAFLRRALSQKNSPTNLSLPVKAALIRLLSDISSQWGE